MGLLHVDFETYSETDIKNCGSYRYMADPSFEILLLSYCFDEDEVKTVDLAQGEPWPQEFLDALSDENVIKIAHNSAFEREAIRIALGLYQDPKYWEDTMIMAAQCGLPMSLGGVTKALGFGEDTAKDKMGVSLIRYFSVPCKPTKANGMRTRNFPSDDPEKWEMYKSYNNQDVVAERAVYNILKKYPITDVEHKFWELDAKINERGIRIDRKLAVNAVLMDNRNKEELTERAIAISGIENPKSVSQVKNWLADQEGQEFPSLNKKVITDIISNLKSEEAKEFMELRSELALSSTSKYTAMLRAMCPDEHVRGTLLFYGAGRTGRFAGRLIQPQNMKRNEMACLDEARNLVKGGHYSALKAIFDGVSDPISQLVRTAMIPEPGCKFVQADFSAIEARVTAWFAKEQWRLKTFKDGGDIYCSSASMMFHVPVVKHGINGELRQKGKIAELALGYGGGIGALKAFGADKMGMSENEMQDIVDRWREASPRICAWWRSMENAAIKAVVKKTQTIDELGQVIFEFTDGILWMVLPSGRKIAYWGAKYDTSSKAPDRKCLSYLGQNQTTKKFEYIETWGGKLVENCVQATARDCLREAMFHLDEEGYDIRFTIHDEVVANEPINGRTSEDMSKVMSRPIPWAPGLPLNAEGCDMPYYKKD